MSSAYTYTFAGLFDDHQESLEGLFCERMLEKESQLPADKRMDFVTIVTPNFAHFAPAIMALDKGFNVVVEKPVTLSLEEAKKLNEKLHFCINY